MRSGREHWAHIVAVQEAMRRRRKRRKKRAGRDEAHIKFNNNPHLTDTHGG